MRLWNFLELPLVTVATKETLVSRTPAEATMRSFLIAALATMALAGCGAPSTPDFVQKAAMSDMYEVQAGKLATEKGQSDAVKQFAQQMVDAHTKTTEELTGIVKSKNIKVDLPSALDSTHQKLIDDLNSASAQDFDKTYANQQVDAHKEAVHLFKKYAGKGDDADVKQFAEKTLPTIEHHLDEAKKLPVGPPSA
jgi:putative membrane protein